MKIKVLTVLAAASFLLWGGIRAYDNVQFSRLCIDHLKRAADSNTIPMAEQELTTAIAYLDANHVTTGYTSILYQSPSEDIGFWYGNLTASLARLKSVPADASLLEQSNLLLKLRETLLDHGKDGESVTSPEGLSIYPDNSAFNLWAWISFILFCVGGVSWAHDCW